MYTGPNIIRDGLVFGYDADDRSTRFYKGEPTVNIANTLTIGAQGGSLTTVTSTPNSKYLTGNAGVGFNGLPVYHEVTSPNTGNNGGFQSGTDFTITGVSTYLKLSFKVYMTELYAGVGKYLGGYAGFYNSSNVNIANTGWSYYVDGVYDHSWSDNPEYLNKWISVVGTVAIPATATYVSRWYVYADYLLTGKMYVAQIQMEEKDHVTQYTPTSRSATTSLLDLTGNTTIDLSNVSFDSTAHPTFNGTSDYMDLGSNITYKTTGGWTIESIVNYSTVAAWYNNITSPANFTGSDTISYNSWFWSVLNNKLALWNISPGVWKYGSTTILPNTYYHTVLTCSDDGTSYQMYLNGVAEGGDHVAYVWNAAYSGLVIRYLGQGNVSNPRRINGQMPIVHIYNRALTQQEITQNFNAYRNRFGI